MSRKKKMGGKEVAFRPQTIIEARYDLDRRQNDILDILLGIVGEGMTQRKIQDMKLILMM